MLGLLYLNTFLLLWLLLLIGGMIPACIVLIHVVIVGLLRFQRKMCPVRLINSTPNRALMTLISVCLVPIVSIALLAPLEDLLYSLDQAHLALIFAQLLLMLLKIFRFFFGLNI